MRGPIRTIVLLAIFIGLPILETYVIIQVGQAIGVGPTILLLIAQAALGAWLIKREGRRTWRALNESIATGTLPGRELADAAIVLIGGVLLMIPGFVTDIFGLFCVLPFTRPVARSALTHYLSRRFLSGPGAPGYPRSREQSQERSGEQTRQRPGPDQVVQGEVVD